VQEHSLLVCYPTVSGPSQLPPPPPAGQESSTFATGDRNVVSSATATSSVHDAAPELPRRPAAAAGSHSRSSSLDNQLIDFSDSGQFLFFLSALYDGALKGFSSDSPTF